MEITFVKPKLSSTSLKEDVLLAINQIIEIDKEISKLKQINLNNYSEFIKEHRKIIKKNIPIVGKTYRFIKQGNETYIHYSFMDILHKIEYFYVSYVSLKSVVDKYSDLIPSVKCIPLDINGHPFKDDYGRYIGVDNYSKGEQINIDKLSEEDYPEITKVFKKITSKKTEQDLRQYNILKRKFGE